MLTPGLAKIAKESKSAGFDVEPYGTSGALIVIVQKHNGNGRILKGVILWTTGSAQNATVELSVARCVRKLSTIRKMIGLEA